MKTVKINEASGLVLDYLVAKCEGLQLDIPPWAERPWIRVLEPGGDQYECPRYSAHWSSGGPIVEKMLTAGFELKPATFSDRFQCIRIESNDSFYGFGPTPLIAAMRGYVAYMLRRRGVQEEMAEVPECLMEDWLVRL